jgi:GGDEF domain-containing protein
LATSESTRTRRFALPDLEDERTSDSIEAFLEGPDVRRGRPAQRAGDETPEATRATALTTSPAHRPAGPARPSNELRTLPGRLEWNAALERESTRAARYGRPASVAIVELKPDKPGQSVDAWLGSLAGPIARSLRQDSRATDLVARVATTRFQMLLPETSEAGAESLAARVAATCRQQILRTGAPVSVRVSVAGTGIDDTLDAALAHALRSIEAA